MKRAYALALCLAAVGAHAATPPDLPPQDVVARWLAQDPAVREAAAQRAAADQVAAQRRLSPNEWTLETGVQQRRYDSDARVREWNLGLERTVRLPGKRRLDAALGERGMDAAQARYDAAVRAALLDLCDLWLDWAMAGELAALAARQADLASANRAAVERRVTAGDAARLDLALADADRDDAERLRREADAEAAIARARLAARFADLPAAPPSLSPPPSQHAAARSASRSGWRPARTCAWPRPSATKPSPRWRARVPSAGPIRRSVCSTPRRAVAASASSVSACACPCRGAIAPPAWPAPWPNATSAKRRCPA